jgi:hypothetical protein
MKSSKERMSTPPRVVQGGPRSYLCYLVALFDGYNIIKKCISRALEDDSRAIGLRVERGLSPCAIHRCG